MKTHRFILVALALFFGVIHFTSANVEPPTLVWLVQDGPTHWSAQYPDWINTTNYVWSVQSKTNLAQSFWQDEEIGYSVGVETNNTGGCELTLYDLGRPKLFFRLKGTLAAR